MGVVEDQSVEARSAAAAATLAQPKALANLDILSPREQLDLVRHFIDGLEDLPRDATRRAARTTALALLSLVGETTAARAPPVAVAAAAPGRAAADALVLPSPNLLRPLRPTDRQSAASTVWDSSTPPGPPTTATATTATTLRRARCASSSPRTSARASWETPRASPSPTPRRGRAIGAAETGTAATRGPRAGRGGRRGSAPRTRPP